MSILTAEPQNFLFTFTYRDYKPICLLPAVGVLRIPSPKCF